MNQTDWNHNVMNGIDPALVEEASLPAGKRSFRPLRIAAAAACMCALLAGMALAAETIFGIPIFKSVTANPFTGEELNGFTTVIDTPEGVMSKGTFKQPLDSFSSAVRELAAALEQGGTDTVTFGSWAELEEYLGADLLSNPMLERGGQDFTVTVGAKDGTLTAVKTDGVYYLNYLEVKHSDETGGGYGMVPVRMGLTVQSYTEHSLIAPEDMFKILGFPEDYTFTHETYTTPGGLAVSIVGAVRPDTAYGRITTYYARFALNGNAVTLSAGCTPDSAHALSTLKEVLDAFQ